MGKAAWAAGAAALACAVLVEAAPPAPAGDAALERRVARLERMVEAQPLLELMGRLDRLDEQVRALRGEVEALRHELEGLRRRQRELYLDTDRRLRDLEAAAPAVAAARPAAPSPAGAPGTPAAPAAGAAPPAAEPAARPSGAPAPVVDEAAARQAYRKAFRLLREGRYEAAAKAFREFLAKHPRSEYADNAQYWLGEAYYVSRRFPEALEAFRAVLERYPRSPKVADALLKIGYVHYELRQWKEAREALEQVRRRFPGSSAARLAERRLERMRKEGH